MGGVCSTDKAVAPAARDPVTKSGSKTGNRSMVAGGGNRSINPRTKEELAAQFVAEFPVDDDVPSYPEGSRQATLLKIFALLDRQQRGYIEVAEWKEYVLQAGLTTEALARELAAILADPGSQVPGGGDPRIVPRHFVAAMARMVEEWDDPRFGRLVADTLTTYRKRPEKQASDKGADGEEAAAEDNGE